MILPDVNVLLYAYRPDACGDERYKRWLGAQVDGAPFGMCPQALAAVVRIATNPRVFRSPDSAAGPLEFASALLRHPNCRMFQPGVRHWSIFADLCRASNARGNLVQDAWFAALAIEADCEWITLDRDYAKFPESRWRAPF